MSEPLLNPVRCLLDALQCGAALVDRHGVLVHCNERFAEMAGRDRDQMLGQPVVALYQDDFSRSMLKEVMGHFDEPAEGEFHIDRPDGTRVPLMFAGRPLTLPGVDAGEPVYRVATAIEITEQKRAYEEIAKLGDTVLEQAMELKRLNQTLEHRVEQRTAELHTANMDAITMLAVASEARDEDTGAHVRRIEAYTARLAQHAGVPEAEARHIGTAAILHDVGKIHIPDGILKKPGPLTPDERLEMQQHTVIGQRILSDQPFFDTARLIARSHHENWDGSGYPDGLSTEKIPLPARIVHLVDVFDALVSKRAYKDAWTPDHAAGEIAQFAGKMFDPTLAGAFDELYRSQGFDDILSG